MLGAKVGLMHASSAGPQSVKRPTGQRCLQQFDGIRGKRQATHTHISFDEIIGIISQPLALVPTPHPVLVIFPHHELFVHGSHHGFRTGGGLDAKVGGPSRKWT
jgi:hypothetical protein